MVRLPVHADVHQSVPASPSIAFEAGLPEAVESALACPDSAQLTTGAPPGPEVAAAAPGRLTSSGVASKAGTVTAASRRIKAGYFRWNAASMVLSIQT